MNQKQEYIKSHYETNKKKIYVLYEFLEKNQNHSKSYLSKCLKCLLFDSFSAKEKLFRLFISSINAAGGNNLHYTGEACKKFFEDLKRLPNPNKKTLSNIEFFNLYSDSKNKISNFEDYFRYINSQKRYKNFGKKKTALFIRDIKLFDSISEERIFKEEIPETHIKIPLDIVLVTVLNLILGLKKFPIEPARDFDLINSFLKDFNSLIIDDIWFWGHFTLQKENRFRIVKINEDMIYSDKYLWQDNIHFKQFEEFIKIVNS